MVLAWISEMLELEGPVANDGSFTLSRSGGSSIEVILQEKDSPRAVSSLVMESPGFKLAFELDEAGRFWHAAGGCGEREVHQMFPALEQTTATLVNAQLQRARENSLFKRVFPRLEAWF